MSKIKKLIAIIIIMLFAIPVFAEEGVVVEKISGSSLNQNVILNNADALDVTFNDLMQSANYSITLKNNTEDIVFVNDIIVDGVSENFIKFTLTEKSLNTMIQPGEENTLELEVKTLDTAHAGKNVDDEITVKFLFGTSEKNPETSGNVIPYVILIVTLIAMLSASLSKISGKRKVTLVIIALLILGTTIVYANDDKSITISGKVKYVSQNLLQPSGSQLNGYKLDYTNASDVWKYAEQVKNIIISDRAVKPQTFAYEFDLTENDKQRVKAYLVENSDNAVKYDLYISAPGVIYAPADSTGLLSFPNVETISGLGYIEFDNTTSMKAMFMNNKKLVSIDKSALNMLRTKDTSFMFYGCENINLTIDDFDLSNVTNYENMFSENDLYNIVKLNAEEDIYLDFKKMENSGKYMVSSTRMNEFPIYYYRGNILNNNVVFANFCWKIVRTTEYGGIKLVYNGVVSASGTCDNSGEATAIGTAKINTKADSPSYAGYMYGTKYVLGNTSLDKLDVEPLFGTKIIWDGSQYELQNPTTLTYVDKSTLEEGEQAPLIQAHYTCLTDETTCKEVYYIVYYDSYPKLYHVKLSGGETIEQAKTKMFANDTPSTIMETVESWYQDNLAEQTNKLEDSIWCNDRNVATGSLGGENSDGTGYSNFRDYKENVLQATPNLTCSPQSDRFTVHNEQGNKKLTYPIGLLTADELTFAGNGDTGYSSDTYLNSGIAFWTMSPARVNASSVSYIYFDAKGKLSYKVLTNAMAIRPSIVLKYGTQIMSGSGTVTDPYVVK